MNDGCFDEGDLASSRNKKGWADRTFPLTKSKWRACWLGLRRSASRSFAAKARPHVCLMVEIAKAELRKRGDAGAPPGQVGHKEGVTTPSSDSTRSLARGR
jgi:hypothetical protein